MRIKTVNGGEELSTAMMAMVMMVVTMVIASDEMVRVERFTPHLVPELGLFTILLY